MLERDREGWGVGVAFGVRLLLRPQGGLRHLGRSSVEVHGSVRWSHQLISGSSGPACHSAACMDLWPAISSKSDLNAPSLRPFAATIATHASLQDLRCTVGARRNSHSAP